MDDQESENDSGSEESDSYEEIGNRYERILDTSAIRTICDINEFLGSLNREVSIGCSKRKTSIRVVPTKDPTAKFEKWEFLPLELKEMIADMLEFHDWINLMAAEGGNTEERPVCYCFPPQIKHFSLYSDVIQEGSKEMEHIHICLNDDSDPSMMIIEECDGYCEFSWNLPNKDIGSFNIWNCPYLKVAERVMKHLFDSDCRSFEFIVNENKTEKSAQSVSKWPYFHSYLKKCLGIENYDGKLIDEKFVLNYMNAQNGKSVEGLESLIQTFDEKVLQASRRDFILKLPNLDAVEVVESSLLQLPAKRVNEFHDDKGKRVFGYCSVSRIDDNAIKISGPILKDEYYHTHFMNIDRDYVFE